VLDYDALVARHGRARWHDERKWLTARMPIASDCLPIFASALARALLALRGPPRKVLVLDLDNTLWGGIVGEDGFAGLKLSAEHPGAAYQAVQRAAKDLAARGVLLAVASKNNPADAAEVLEKHPGMLLRPRDFAAQRINWNDKAQSLREIAAELNLGTDALVFMDDNPAERERIRGELPEVYVLELPEDPMSWAAALRDCPGFERAATTDEDRARAQQYAEQRQRAALSQTAGSVDEYLRSLEMVLRIARVGPVSLARAAQLTQKTNQYNLTTRRRSEDELRALLAQPGAAAFTYAVADRFGDNGIVGLAIVRSQGAALQLDTFLMSCRVIGRTVETAMLAHLLRHARASGASHLEGWFTPTAKNAPARDFYPTHGFTRLEERDGATRWVLELGGEAERAPAAGSWFSVIEENG
jgi:FkbH-like protein